MSNKAFFLSIVAMIVTLVTIGLISARPKPVVVQTNLENMPAEIAGYRGTDDSFPESVYRELNADKHVYRHYLAAGGSKFDLYIGYYGTAKGGRTGHNPYACLPGSGWAIVDTRKIRLRQSEHPAEVNYIRARRDDVNAVMVHWYQTAGTKVVSNGFQQNITRFWGRFLYNRNDGAFVQITTRVADNRVAEAESEIAYFAGQVLRVLPGYWPVEE